MHEVPPGRHADLTLMQVRPPCGDVGCPGDVGIGQYELRVVAAEREVHALEQWGGGRGHLAPRGRRAGE